jgi:cell division septal protein FtsQ
MSAQTQTRRKAAPKRAVRPAKRRKATARKPASNRKASRATNLLLPAFLSFCILVCLAAMGFLGFQSVTASPFFDVTAVEVRGAERASKDDIERLVSTQTEKSGAWSADLQEIKASIEKLPFVKSAAISRVLPDGIRVTVNERIPLAIVKLDRGNFLIDEEGAVLGPAASEEPALPFVMIGWDEGKSEQADRENVERVKLYQKMLGEWRQFDLASRVLQVNLADLREPRAVLEDSGELVSIALGKSDFGQHLKQGIGAIVGKGQTFEAVNLVGTNMILAPRKGE